MTFRVQLFAIMALLSLAVTAQEGYSRYTVEKRETIYGISKKFGIGKEALLEANPSLRTEGLKQGQVIMIPSGSQTESREASSNSQCRAEYKVKKKETIFGICKKFDVAQEDFLRANPQVKANGLKKGQVVCIPSPTVMVATSSPTKAAVMPQPPVEKAEETPEKKKTLKAAVLMPFAQDAETAKADNLHSIEFYEGFLMAVNKLKHEGYDLDITAISTGYTEKTIAQTLQQHDELKKMDIVFGPGVPTQMPLLANYCKHNDIRLVIPFASKTDGTIGNDKVFQVNAPRARLFPEVFDHIFRLFPDYNFVFLDAGEADADKQDFIAGLKQELQKRNQTFDELSDFKLAGDTLRYYIPQDRKNLFIPTSGKSSALTKLLPQLVVAHRISPEIKMVLFGYPEWQLYTDDHLANFYEMDTYFYSSFYTNNLYTASIQFTNEYRNWYSKDLAMTYPRYPMLGYDIAYYFLTGLLKFGNDFEQNLNDYFVPTIQSGFKFTSNAPNDGYLNRKVYLVHFSPDFELVKIDFD
ncbi:MAG: LysM peptidoglycan-binding domain-containing protein [Bacteroidales bacterium]|nr:LysM peptidoglycan-binding domain-containing protein [Bacteroidales bacterium]